MKSLKKKNRRAGQSKRNGNKGTTESKCRSLVPYDGNSNSVVVGGQEAEKSFLEETPVDVILAEPKPSVEMLAKQIGLRWHRTLEGIFETARIVAHADATLKSPDKKLLMQQLNMKKSYFSKLARIGRDERIQRSNVIKALLPNISVMYAMTYWTDEKVAEYVARESKPTTSSKKENSLQLELSTKRIPRAADRVLTFLNNMTVEQAREIDEVLNQLEGKYPLQVDSYSGKFYGRVFALVDDFPRFPSPLDSIDPDLALLPARAEAAE